jgi:hypothetical protein
VFQQSLQNHPSLSSLGILPHSLVIFGERPMLAILLAHTGSTTRRSGAAHRGSHQHGTRPAPLLAERCARRWGHGRTGVVRAVTTMLRSVRFVNEARTAWGLPWQYSAQRWKGLAALGRSGLTPCTCIRRSRRPYHYVKTSKRSRNICNGLLTPVTSTHIYNGCCLEPVTYKRTRTTPGLASTTFVTNVDFW